MNTVLSVRNLTKIFYKKRFFRTTAVFHAVQDISFDLHKGEILGFLGPNGAGKTTTIQMLLGLMTPTKGSITYFGQDFFSHRSELLQRVSFASAYTKFPAQLTVYENLQVYGRLYGLSAADRAQRIEKYLKFFGMWHRRHAMMGPLSAGQITRVMLAKAFLADPDIILLDEPTASLDPDVVEDVHAFILEQQRERNISILFTSHNMTEIERVCDRVLILKDGLIIANNTPEQIAGSISKTKLQLMVGEEQRSRLSQHLQQQGWQYQLTDPFVEIGLDEHDIAKLLAQLAHAGIEYSQISIAKPTLQDYFLYIARDKKGKG